MFGMRDRVATGLVAAAVAVGVGWLVGVPGLREFDVRLVAVAVVALGIVASMSAVVPAFGELIHGWRIYAAVTSVLGTAAFVAAIVTLLDSNETALVALLVLTVVLWGAATARHTGMLGGHRATIVT